MCCVILNLSGSFSTQIKMESEEWQIQAEGKSKNMINYSGRFAAADNKAENSQVCFCTMPYGNQQRSSGMPLFEQHQGVN